MICVCVCGQVTGAVGAIVTMAIGYAMVYRDYYDGEGLCFNGPPGIRRACILDLGGGVMSMTLGVLLLIIELVSAYINQKDVSFSLTCNITFIILHTVESCLIYDQDNYSCTYCH